MSQYSLSRGPCWIFKPSFQSSPWAGEPEHLFSSENRAFRKPSHQRHEGTSLLGSPRGHHHGSPALGNPHTTARFCSWKLFIRSLDEVVLTSHRERCDRICASEGRYCTTYSLCSCLQRVCSAARTCTHCGDNTMVFHVADGTVV